MIRYVKGDIFCSGAEALVNPVNCVGVMGAGLAKQFKERFPACYHHYRRCCTANLVRVGEVLVSATLWQDDPRWIVHFPTKDNWREPSRIEWIEDGLRDLVAFVLNEDIRSIALPMIGCGLGGLDWRDVRPLIERAFAGLPDVDVMVYGPAT